MIVIVDSGVANLRSVTNTLNHLGIPARVAQTGDDLTHAEKIILPGVGAFAAGMQRMRERGFVVPLRAAVAAGVPLLGICLGMQMLFERSEEMGDHEGLGLLPGRVVRFPSGGPKVPHIGWNQIEPVLPEPPANGKLPGEFGSRLLRGIAPGSYAYFVHSYYALTPDANVLACTGYGLTFPAVVGRDSVFGAQFHPEKSQQTGLRLLRNFVEMNP